MENRLCLNKRPVYELPDGVLIKTWFSAIPNRKQPSFKPDLILNMFLKSSELNIEDGGSQMWIKSNNKELLQFLKEYDWKLINISSNNLPVWRVKKAILEEFYGVKNGE